MERDKEIFKLAVFGVRVAALLIDFYSQQPQHPLFSPKYTTNIN
jgi:hypothetical protein